MEYKSAAVYMRPYVYIRKCFGGYSLLDAKYRKACTILSAWQFVNKGKKWRLTSDFNDIIRKKV